MITDINFDRYTMDNILKIFAALVSMNMTPSLDPPMSLPPVNPYSTMQTVPVFTPGTGYDRQSTQPVYSAPSPHHENIRVKMESQERTDSPLTSQTHVLSSSAVSEGVKVEN